MSPVGHSLAGITIYLGFCAAKRKTPRKATLLPVIFLSNLPDIDLIPAFWEGFPRANGGHQGFTHTAVFCLLVALIAGVAHWVRWGKWDRTVLSAAFFFPAVHVIADAFTLSDPHYGVMLLYPFSTRKYLLAPIFLAIERKSWITLFSLSNMQSVIHEIFVFLPFLAWLTYLTVETREPGKTMDRMTAAAAGGTPDA